MFGLGFTEILILILIAFLVCGPNQFPIVVKTFIKILNELRQTFTDVKTEFHDVEVEVKKQVHQITEDVHRDFESAKETKPKEPPSLESKNLKQKDQTSHSNISSAKGLSNLEQKETSSLKKGISEEF